MAEPFVRVTVTDDLRRSRLTVFFRLLLAIPHFVWWWLWSIAAAVAAIGNWFATLVMARSPNALHRFLTAYIRYSTQLFAYLYLAANPYPPFTGGSYPVDVELGAAERQRRWSVALRLFLAIPALVLAAAFEGTGFYGWFGDRETAFSWGGGTLLIAAFFGWFVCVVRGRMPHGFRDLQVYGLRYVAQVAAYVFVLTERYPNLDPAETPGSGPADHPVRLTVDDDLRRSRLTVLFRFFLAIPHFVWVVLWSAAAVLAAVATWFAALVTGRPPRPLHRFLSAFVRYSYHLNAYLTLAANPFPGFTGTPGSYPVDVQLPPPEPQRRLVTAFRIFLAIPALAVSGALDALLFLSAFFGWFVALATGRMPRSLRSAQAYALRYGAQVEAYVFLVTGRYPYSGPVLAAPAPPAPEPPRPAEPPAVA